MKQKKASDIKYTVYPTGKTQPNRLFRILILNYMPKRMNSRHLGLDTDNSETLNDITMLSNGISVNNTFVRVFIDAFFF